MIHLRSDHAGTHQVGACKTAQLFRPMNSFQIRADFELALGSRGWIAPVEKQRR